MNKYRILQVCGLFFGVVLACVAGCGKNDDAMAAAGSDYWLTDFEKAKETARQQNKELLIDFAGSDWCYWCKRLDKEVFSKPAFLQEAGKQYVLVLIDFPSDKSHQSAEIQKQNDRLSEQFGVQGFPTVFLADANGQPYARTGYIEGGPQIYLEHLRELRAQKPLP